MKGLESILIVGASSGIGWSTFKKIHRGNTGETRDIYLTTRNKARLIKQLASNNIKLAENNLFELDLESKESVELFIKTFIKRCKSLNGLVMNAGYIETDFCLMTSSCSLSKHFSINYFSQIKIIQSLTRKFFLKNNNGSVVALSTSAVKDSNAGRLAYASSKAALETSIKIFSRELGKKNIRFNAIAPGLTDTNLMRNSTSENDMKEWIGRTDLRKMSTAEDVANLIVFLLSCESSNITGQVINIDGGK